MIALGTLVEVISDSNYFGIRQFIIGYKPKDQQLIYYLGSTREQLIRHDDPYFLESDLRVVHRSNVWLEIATGRFSDSWMSEKKGPCSDAELIKTSGVINAKQYEAWKLIQYECLNDHDFQFSRLMQLR